ARRHALAREHRAVCGIPRDCLRCLQQPPTPHSRDRMKKWLPLVITLLFAGWYAGKLRVPADTDWAFNEFGRIPVVVDGRHMPMDTLARTVLTLLRGKQEANYEPWKSFW